MAQEEEYQSRFPFRLHVVLSEVEREGLTHIISWLPCGTRFKVHDTAKFERDIMPKIGRCTRYKSFLRQLSMYEFHRTTFGPLKSTYHHPFFSRNHIEGCRGVIRGVEVAIDNPEEKTNPRYFEELKPVQNIWGKKLKMRNGNKKQSKRAMGNKIGELHRSFHSSASKSTLSFDTQSLLQSYSFKTCEAGEQLPIMIRAFPTPLEGTAHDYFYEDGRSSAPPTEERVFKSVTDRYGSSRPSPCRIEQATSTDEFGFPSSALSSSSQCLIAKDLFTTLDTLPMIAAAGELQERTKPPYIIGGVQKSTRAARLVWEDTPVNDDIVDEIISMFLSPEAETSNQY